MMISYKKGQGLILDGITFAVIIIVFVIIVASTWPVINDVYNDLVGDEDFNQTEEAVQSIQTVQNTFPSWFDGAVISLMVFFAISIFLGGLLIDVHPVFVIIGILALIIFAIFGFVFQDAWDDLKEDEVFSTLPTDFPITNWIMTHFGIVLVTYALLFIVPLFAKAYRGDG